MVLGFYVLHVPAVEIVLRWFRVVSVAATTFARSVVMLCLRSSVAFGLLLESFSPPVLLFQHDEFEFIKF